MILGSSKHNNNIESSFQSFALSHLSRVRVFATPRTAPRQAPSSLGFSRQEYWSGGPFPSPGDRPDPEIKPGSPALQVYSLPAEPPGKPQSMGDVAILSHHGILSSCGVLPFPVT